MTVEEIVKEWLKEHGFDGLCGDDCGCLLDEAPACGDVFGSCEPGYLARKEDCSSSCECFPSCLTTNPSRCCPYAATGDVAQPFETEEVTLP